MKPEPLKDKKHITNTFEIESISDKDHRPCYHDVFYYYEDDIKLAVEWLKKQIKYMDKPFMVRTKEDKIIKLIDKSFEDVME